MVYQSLPGICFVGYVDCNRLQRHSELKAQVGLPVAVFADIIPVNYAGVPTCECQSDYDNNGRLEKTTLKFVTTDRLQDLRRVAFVIKDCNGKAYIIGHREPPFPIIKWTKATGTPGGDSSAITVEITLFAHKSLTLCAIK